MVMMMAKILDLYHDDDNHGEYCYRDHEESSLKMMVMGFIVIMTDEVSQDDGDIDDNDDDDDFDDDEANLEAKNHLPTSLAR